MRSNSDPPLTLETHDPSMVSGSYVTKARYQASDSDHYVSSVKIAICICTCARPNSLQRLLDALSGIELGALDPRDIHFVVIDNRPGGRAREICNKALERLPVALHFVEEPTPGISFARNRAITVALDLGVAWIAFRLMSSAAPRTTSAAHRNCDNSWPPDTAWPSDHTTNARRHHN